MDAKNTMMAEETLCQAMQAEPPLGIQIQMNGGKFAFEKIGLDGELHKTDCYGEFWPIQDHADIYGDGSMVSLRHAA